VVGVSLGGYVGGFCGDAEVGEHIRESEEGNYGEEVGCAEEGVGGGEEEVGASC